jgi:phage-related minor tail protein
MATEIDALSVRVEADVGPFQAALRDLAGEADRFAGAITTAFKDAVVRGRDFESVLRSLALRLADIALDAALKPVGAGLSGLIGGLLSRLGGGAFAHGGVVGAGQVRPFAAGGLIATPSYFPLANGGLGLAGEAGPEAILPLARASDGRLGVAAGGAAPVTVIVNVSAPDAMSFRKSEALITALLARAVGRGTRAL